MNYNFSLLCTIILIFTNCIFIEGATFRLNSGVILTADNWTHADTWLNESNQNVNAYPGDYDIIQFGADLEVNSIIIDFDFSEISTSLYFQPISEGDYSGDITSVLTIKNNANVVISNLIDNGALFTLTVEENSSLTITEELFMDRAFVKFDIYGSFSVLNKVNFTKEQYLNIYSDAVVKFEGDFNTTGVMLVVQEDAILEVEGQYSIGGESNYASWDIDGFLIIHNGIDLICHVNLVYDINVATGGVYIDYDEGTTDICNANSDNPGWAGIDGANCKSALFCSAVNNEDYEKVTIPDLPVNLISFILIEEKESVRLEWVTASEQNSERFDIEVSSNKKDWTVIGSVSAQGNSNATVEYEFVDINKPSYYYRLAQYDLDGKVEYFGVLTYNKKTAFKSNVYPTFVGRGEYLYINFEGVASSAKSSISIVNMKGEIVEENQFLDLSLSNSLQSYHIKNDLSTGLYFITVKCGKDVKTMRFIIK
ncbi:T9SS type A sorting domain-containing protein [Flammeovirga kamogawensis]|uniref:T9SS type A sorting domain-containing protein n=1 Tax=Flammeovirga kamogawensis TaxID=373891 RepID=A0ABX8GY02_9BACT|nr:T9SS type A sorting domain-containing protein [Flammeovirga kamogawensis]MBB6461246.1 hypothetical protein [Flammeovirga kamogawensis]QWG07805.1 T9SS type A sorting domain-containing protein [Flammeovirga kamogawensis]TRX69611.1 T9SS type A sorting domain-containing protein [Flammeovirga kamogawensis]